jgi:hypothetical protein
LLCAYFKKISFVFLCLFKTSLTFFTKNVFLFFSFVTDLTKTTVEIAFHRFWMTIWAFLTLKSFLSFYMIVLAIITEFMFSYMKNFSFNF